MTTDDTIDLVVEIERLAALDPIVYEGTRSETAKRLGMRAHVLDRAVKKKRRELGLNDDDDDADDDGQGRAVKINDPLPWHEPIDGDRLATTLAAVVKTYVVLPDAAANVLAIWVLHTWLVSAFMISPRLALVSPTKGCGKTTVLRLLSKVVRRPKRAGSISPAALFRVVEKFRPTILLDETEKYIEPNGDLHALLNEGHCTGATVVRVLGEKQELREFAIYGPVAYARNGRLPDDLEQRSIVIEMQRRRANEALADLRDDRCQPLHDVARMCTRWSDDTAARVSDYSDPDMGELLNRNADNWRPLFSLADLIGADWPEHIREAAAILAPRESESIGPMLLADIKVVFDDKKTDWLPSAKLCDTLATIEGRPWADWKAGKPITPNQLARLLKSFGIRPDNQRAGEQVLKGYHRHQFEEAWERYLAHEGVNEPLHRYKPNAASTPATFRSATHQPDVADQKCEKPLGPNGCSGVADQKGDNGPAATNGGSWPAVCEHCGNSERPGNPVHPYDKDGQTYLLHPACWTEWLAGPGPDGWTFNLDDASP